MKKRINWLTTNSRQAKTTDTQHMTGKAKETMQNFEK